MSQIAKNHQNLACKHYDECGGCSLQHLSQQDYQSLKRGRLVQIIADLGVSADVVQPMIEVGRGSRRRAEFKIGVNKGDIKIGFFAEKSHDVFDLTECLVSEDRLVAILPQLKTCLQTFKKAGRVKAVNLTCLAAGFDALISTNSEMIAADKEKLVNFARENNITRLSIDEQCVYGSGDANISFADVEVNLPMGAFLQATEAGESAITELVTKYLDGCEHLADLYSGCGTYSFPLIKQAKTLAAFEGGEEMVSAMHNAIIRHGLDGKMQASVRDLFARPLKEHELNQFDGVVINPPRNGALPQVQNLSKSEVSKIMMVSCNPDTFKRDAKCLLGAGYNLTMAVAIDQFYWSGHLEVVGVFAK